MTDYATGTECKAFTRITYDDFRDYATEAEFNTFVSLLAGFASRAMESYADRDWAYHDDSTDGKTYSVGPNYQRSIKIDGPVIAITSVEYRDGPSDTFTTVDADDYSHLNFPKFGPVYKSPVTHLKRLGFGAYTIGRLPRNWTTRVGSTSWRRWRVVWWRGYENIRVKYTWGYTNIPDEINRICIMIVDDWLKRSIKDEVGKRVKATSPEDLQMIMRYEIPEHLKTALKGWKSTGGIAAI